jgi:hypothetical protein
MEKMKFSQEINASAKKVWAILWNDDSYRKWTSVFSEGSHAVSDWNEGSKILFLSPTGDGMHSMIAKKIPNEFMSFKHLGTMKNGKEETAADDAKSWSGSMENYSLKENGNHTTLEVEIDIVEDFKKYFEETFPKALEKVKELAEKE